MARIGVYAPLNNQSRSVTGAAIVSQSVPPPVACICGSNMIQGMIQQGHPKCANVNCQKDLMDAVTGKGDCYYCPNNVAPVHPNGFFYCVPCALAVQQYGGARMVPQPAQVPVQQGESYGSGY
eukprot:CAMPEP_0197040408 /NCGR_PEP_ID=MMETSP1384-20130603/17109_1 /TAXON_ID=29189 /ORGANISM="Ammonia sp." /LENGTH=122 /DNA_ID=CAMNT_0042471157 /DNA_START=354 /DNA_END=722 /DNA_ORIENTATION=+